MQAIGRFEMGDFWIVRLQAEEYYAVYCTMPMKEHV